uniref:Uncharacterized protein n=1 Tax=Timema genevievae TaxID=629358 RepID=A0A7R9PPT2_TIMGE|nr:unnamed protein product [Timema genevievae]
MLSSTAEDGEIEVQISLKWTNPDEEGLVKYLCTDKAFNEDRVRNAAKKLAKARTGSTQARLDSFFKVLPNTSNAASKRKVEEKKGTAKKPALGYLGKTTPPLGPDGGGCWLLQVIAHHKEVRSSASEQPSAQPLFSKISVLSFSHPNFAAAPAFLRPDVRSCPDQLSSLHGYTLPTT